MGLSVLRFRGSVKFTRFAIEHRVGRACGVHQTTEKSKRDCRGKARRKAEISRLRPNGDSRCGMPKFAWADTRRCPRGFGKCHDTRRIDHLPYTSSVDGDEGEVGGSSVGAGWSSLPARIVTSTICGCVSSLIPRVCDHRSARG